MFSESSVAATGEVWNLTRRADRTTFTRLTRLRRLPRTHRLSHRSLCLLTRNSSRDRSGTRNLLQSRRVWIESFRSERQPTMDEVLYLCLDMFKPYLLTLWVEFLKLIRLCQVRMLQDMHERK